MGTWGHKLYRHVYYILPVPTCEFKLAMGLMYSHVICIVKFNQSRVRVPSTALSPLSASVFSARKITIRTNNRSTKNVTERIAAYISTHVLITWLPTDHLDDIDVARMYCDSK